MRQRKSNLEMFEFHVQLPDDPNQGGPKYFKFEKKFLPNTLLLEVLEELQVDRLPDLRLKWTCRIGVCRRCQVEVNQKMRLSCCSRLNEFGNRLFLSGLDCGRTACRGDSIPTWKRLPHNLLAQPFL